MLPLINMVLVYVMTTGMETIAPYMINTLTVILFATQTRDVLAPRQMTVYHVFIILTLTIHTAAHVT